MTTTERTKFVVNEDGDVPAAGIDVHNAPITPDGETWQITRVLFADKNIGDNLSGGFLVDWGDGGGREIVAQAFLTGNTLDLPMEFLLRGDGSKRIRVIRENTSASAKKMVAMVSAFKRL